MNKKTNNNDTKIPGYGREYCAVCKGTYYFEVGYATTCPYTKESAHADDGKIVVRTITSKREAYEKLSSVEPFSTAKKYWEVKACEFLWTTDQSGSYAANYVAKGSYQKGVKAAGSRLIWETPYCLTEEQLKVLQADHPGYWFITGVMHHDHPIAHINTQIATRGLVSRIETSCSGERILDLHGNPAANLKNTRFSKKGNVYDTVIEKVTPKDFVRSATKWGDLTRTDADKALVIEDTMRNFTTFPTGPLAERISEYGTFVATHTLYYYQQNEIASLLSKRSGSKLYALVHKFDGDAGTLSHGELKFERRTLMGRDQIKQTNVMTGETYDHPANDWIFSGASAWTDGELGMAWTIQKAGTDTFLVTLTHCPPSQCRMDPYLELSNNESRVEGAAEPVVVAVGGKTFEFEGVDREAALVMINHVSGKVRSPDQFKDHLSATKRAMKKSKNSGTGKDAASTAMYSFLAKYEEDKAVAGAYLATSSSRAEFKRALDGVVPLSTLSMVDKLLTIAIHVADNQNSGKKLLLGGLRMAHQGVISGGTSFVVNQPALK